MERREPIVIRLVGEHDIASRSDVTAALQAAGDNPAVIVDLTSVDYVDSTTIEELFRAIRRAGALGGKLALVAPNERLVRILSIAGVTRLARIVDTLDEARAAFLA
ncbi:MAG TPA: STAS domain-containing protein [Candidatus Sulfotelmatobacter sp.]|nr:STAS domain-containing protein [Candidatus Sulfotelmatobacter sp.]